ncbi:MAG TPA: hypothetical protein VN685_12755, partial [Rhizomicrobium sp.]|nr:hypothetical protein [Rhizomicrobium sp.]
VAAGFLFISCLVWSFPADEQFMAPAGSLQALTSCITNRLYTAKSPDTPPAVAASFAGPGAKLAFRLCSDLELNTHYFLREPAPAEKGICRVREIEVFPGGPGDAIPVDHVEGGVIRSDDIPGWKWMPPPDWEARHYSRRESDFAMLTDQPCPPGDDAAYIPVDQVTDGMLKSFDHLWRSVIVSPETFDRTFAHVEARSNGGGPVDPKYISALKNEIFSAPGQPLRLYDMDCAKYSNDCNAFVGNQRHSYEIGFDIGDKGLILTRLVALEAVI